MKKTVRIFLLAVLMVCALCVTAGAEENVAYPVEGGNIYFNETTGTIVGCDGSVRRADIPETINGIPVTSIKNGAFAFNESIKEVIIPNSVTEIGITSFVRCTRLKDIVLSNNLSVIRERAFLRCDGLENIYFKGTEEEWKAISVENGNESLDEAEMYFNGSPLSGSNLISGFVTNMADFMNLTAVLTRQDGVEFSMTVPKSGGFFECVENGTYRLEVFSNGCLPYIFENIVIEDSNVELGKISLILGDVNEDGKINIADMGMFRQEFGHTGGEIVVSSTDINGDGKVNIADMGIFRQNFGKTTEKDCTQVVFEDLVKGEGIIYVKEDVNNIRKSKIELNVLLNGEETIITVLKPKGTEIIIGDVVIEVQATTKIEAGYYEYSLTWNDLYVLEPIDDTPEYLTAMVVEILEDKYIRLEGQENVDYIAADDVYIKDKTGNNILDIAALSDAMEEYDNLQVKAYYIFGENVIEKITITWKRN